MLVKIMNKIRFVLVLLLLLSVGFQDGLLQSSGNDKGVQNIINKSDSLFIAQNKPLSGNEWDRVVQEIYSKTSASLKKATEYYEDNHRFNGAVLVAKDGVPVFETYIGKADFEYGKLLNNQSRFQLASVSKQFTAVAVLMLQQEGKLHIDSALTDYLPDLKYDHVTLRHLLTHKAGFPDYLWLISRHWEKDEPPQNRDIVDMLAKHPVRLQFKPGSKFRYSNTGYCLLAAVVEEVSGFDFDAFMKERVFKPLKMNDTFAYSAAKDTIDDTMVRGFRYSGGHYSKVQENLMEGTFGDKGIYSTPRDLVKWMQGLRQGKLLSEDLLELALSASDNSSDELVNYGMGFRIYDNYYGKMIYHNGSWSGFRTTLRSYPEEKVTIVVLSNNSYRKTGDMARALASAIMSDYEANTVYELAVDFTQEKQVPESELVTVGNITDLKNLQSVMIGMNRSWMAYRLNRFADELNQQTYEWIAMNQESKEGL